MPQVKRLGFAGQIFINIPFSPSQFPNLEQVMIGEYQSIPHGLENIPKLKSLIIASQQIKPRAKVEINEDWCHIAGSYSTDSVLNLLSSLEEISFPDCYHPFYLSEKTLNHSLKKIEDIELIHISGSFFVKKNPLRINFSFELENFQIPYPEVALLASVNPQLISPSKSFDNYIENTVLNFDLDSFSQLTFPLSPSIGKPAHIIKPIRKNGEFLLKYDNGVNLAQGYFKAGKPHGKWLFWYVDGTVCEERYYENGVETNNWVVYTDSGDTLRVLNFIGGSLQYCNFYRYENIVTNTSNKIRAVTKYIFRINIQKETEISKSINYPTYLEDDTITQIKTYSNIYNDSIKVIIKYEKYYLDLFLFQSICTTFFTDTNMALQRLCVDINPNGEVKHSYNYNSYSIDTSWYANKKIKSVERYRDKNYYFREWDENGILTKEFYLTRNNYNESIENKIFYANGKVIEKSEWKDGKRHGLTIIYDESGEVISKRMYFYGN
jgi:antitoxin component YwqK of YwqJK toxin-antitoxin module